MRFGTDYYATDYAGFLDTVEVGERIGFDLIGHGDSQCLWRDPYVSLAAAAMRTQRVRLGPMVTNTRTRHLSVTAASAASLHDLTGHRAVLGIGSGDSALLNIGQQPDKLERFTDVVRSLRALVRGEPVRLDGHEVQLSWVDPDHPVPIFHAADGPRKQEIAGMYADGVLVSNGLTSEVIRDTIENVARGAERVGRDPSEIEIWWMVNFAFAESVEGGTSELAWLLAASVDHVFRFTFDGKRVPADVRPGLRSLMARYTHDGHAVQRGKQRHAELVHDLGLTEWLGERFAVTGPPEACRQRFRELARDGATNLMVTQHVPDPVGLLERFGTEIIEPLRDESDAVMHTRAARP